MLTSLHIASRLQVTLLLAIHHPPFEKLYHDGVYWSLFRERCTTPITDRFLLDNLRATLKGTGGEEQQAYRLPTIGFHFGRLHGAILSAQTSNLRPDVTALASFQNQQAARGYDIGREWYFVESLLEQPDERTLTDTSLLERLQEIEGDSVYFNEEEDTWYYAFGCILGELSGQLFPATPEESARWEAERRFWQTEAECTARPAAVAQPLDLVPVVKYTV